MRMPPHSDRRSPILATTRGPRSDPSAVPRPIIIMALPIAACEAPKSLASQEPMKENEA